MREGGKRGDIMAEENKQQCFLYSSEGLLEL